MDGLLEVDLPADPRSLRAARLVTLEAASRSGLDCDAADDVCLALDEVCFAIFGLVCPGDRIVLSLRPGSGAVHDGAPGGGVQIDGQARLANGGHGFALGDFAHALLAVALDGFAVEPNAAGVHFVLTKRPAALGPA